MMRILRFIPVLALAVLLVGCDSLFETEETLWEGRVVEFRPTAATVNIPAADVEPRTHTMTLQFVAAHEAQDNTVTFRVVGDETTAVEGTHYEFITTGGQATIPANNSFGSIQVRILTAGLEPGQSRRLVVELTPDGTVPPSENYKLYTLTMNKAAE